MTPFRILSEASEELEACVNYYNSQRTNLGTEFLAEFERTAERILKLPKAARRIREDIRSKPIHRFPFYVLYRSLSFFRGRNHDYCSGAPSSTAEVLAWSHIAS